MNNSVNSPFLSPLPGITTFNLPLFIPTWSILFLNLSNLPFPNKNYLMKPVSKVTKRALQHAQKLFNQTNTQFKASLTYRRQGFDQKAAHLQVLLFFPSLLIFLRRSPVENLQLYQPDHSK